MEINNIYKARFYNKYEKYYGFLRNEKEFNIGDNVFIGHHNDSIFRGTVRGVELTDDYDNPTRIYKVEIPKGLVYDFDGKEETSIKLDCDRVFASLDDAKQSRIMQINKMQRLELESVERFFNQFKEEQS
jgi:hypothetical protein